MRKINKSFLDKILESDWKYSAKVAVIVYICAFLLFPIFFPTLLVTILLPTVQFFAKFICIICMFISVIKLFFDNDKPKPIDFEKVEPSISSSNARSPFDPKRSSARIYQNHTDQEIKSDSIIDEPTIKVNERQLSITDKWTIEFINVLEWKRFEDLCSYYFSEIGTKNKQTPLGADGGVDIMLFGDNSDQATAIVQCKKWTNVVGVKLIREFLGVMHHMGLTKGFFITSDKFNKEAIRLATENNIQLLDGQALINELKKLTPHSQQKIYDAVTQGDYTTPTCVRCGIKMVLRQSAEKEFWGCKNYPRCRTVINIKSQSNSSNKSNNLHHLLY